MVLLWTGLFPAAAYAEESTAAIRFAVLANRPKPDVAERWQPLARHFQNALQNRDVVLLPMTYPELEAAIARRDIDLVMTPPAFYVAMSVKKNLYSPLATLVEWEQGLPLAEFGGVVITRGDHPRIQALQDLRGLRVASSDRDSLGSYQSQAYELLRLGIRPGDYQLTEMGTMQDRIVEAVLAGEVDAGFVRTGLLEQMSREGRLELSRLRIVQADQVPPYPLILSTRLYPQWALAAMPWLDAETARLLAAAALALPPRGEVAQAVRISGFNVPGDYRVVEAMMRELRSPPFDEKVPLQVVWEDYRWAMLAGFLLLTLALVWAGSSMVRLRRQRLRNLEQMRQAASVFQHAREGIIITGPEGTILDVNAAFSEITGYTRAEVLGQKPSLLRSGRHDAAFYASLWDTLQRRGEWSGEVWNRRKNGEVYPQWLTISTVLSPKGDVLRHIGLFSDISDLKTRENELRRIAHHDALTGLPNRVMLADRLQQSLMRCDRNRKPLAVAYLDIDGFKKVNDTHGHAMGDRLLEGMARRMQETLREGDTLARLGGDEFVCLLADLDDPSLADAIIQRLITCIAEPLIIDNQELRVSASIGVTFYPQAEKVKAEQLLRQADEAMYLAKQQGKNRYHYHPSHTN